MNQKSYAAAAVPIVLVRAAKPVDTPDDGGFFWRRDIPDFLAALAESPQQIELRWIRVGQLAAAADARHLRTAGLAPRRLAAFLARDMKEQLWLGDVRHIDDGRAVFFLLV